MAEASQETAGGLFASLKTLASSLVGIVQTRLELLATDVAEERERLTALLVLAQVALFCLGVGVVLLAMLIVVVFWESHRIAALGALTGVFLIAGIATGWLAVHRLRSKPRLFAASLDELAKDRQQLGSGP